jgi:hypothetical protein
LADIHASAVTKQMLFDLACTILDDLKELDAGLGDIKRELHEMCDACVEIRRDFHGIHTLLVRQEERLDRIDQHLAVNARPQSP